MASIKSLLLLGALLLAPYLAQADPPFNPPGPSFNPPGPPPWIDTGGGSIQSVPIPATHLLFGMGFIALPWIRSRILNKK